MQTIMEKILNRRQRVLAFAVAGFVTLALLGTGAADPGPDRCDGSAGPAWNLPYGCDLDVSYAAPFLVTDTRNDEQGGFTFYEQVDSYDIHTLDVFYPRSCLQARNCRVLIDVHGGAWKDYYKRMIDAPAAEGGQNAPWFLAGRQGWIVVVPDYRLCTPDVVTAASCPSWPDTPPDTDPPDCANREQAAVYPDNVEDIDLVVTWVYAHAHEYGAKAGGSDQHATDVWLLGHSAGGHLVMDWATNPMFASHRTMVRGVIGLSGAYDIPELSPLLAQAVFYTFKAHDGKTARQWQETGSPTRNIMANASPPYPLFLLFDTGSSDLANLGAPVTIGETTYPDITQEFVDTFAGLGYPTSRDVTNHQAKLWHVQLDPSQYDHIDEYAATAYTGDNTDPAYFEPLYLPWISEADRDCTNPAVTLGPNNQDFSDNCAHFAKPPANSWVQPTDVVVRWIETVDRAANSLPLPLLMVPILAPLHQR